MMASKYWEAMPGGDGPDWETKHWQVFRKLDTGEEQWLGGTGDKDEMEWTAEYAEGLERQLAATRADAERYRMGLFDAHGALYEIANDGAGWMKTYAHEYAVKAADVLNANHESLKTEAGKEGVE